MTAFENALADCKAKSIIVRAVVSSSPPMKQRSRASSRQIVCNPQNPLGRTYSRETLLAYATFCEENDLHLVSDEIYAMSVYDNPSAWDADARHALLYTAG